MNEHDPILHANCVAVAGKGVLIAGPSGSGKSSLSLQLMALGADLVADDRTILCRAQDRIVARAPVAITGLIEARGVGILRVDHLAVADLVLAVDMGQIEVARLPQPHSMTVLDLSLPCLHKVDAPYFPAAILAYLRGL